MLPGWLIVVASFGYLSLLFAIAYYGDRRSDQGRSVILNPYIYALSIAVYCTAWTFYGSVGLAARAGVGFLPIYLGPTLMFTLGWVVLRKIIRISKVHRITSIADFVSSRYGKSHVLGGLVSVIAVIGIMPYISLQLDAISASFNVLLNYPDISNPVSPGGMTIFGDTAMWVAVLLAVFSILFGTRHIDATEHHEGMVAAIAFESVVKLVAFISVGVFVTFGLFDGFGDLFDRAVAEPRLAPLMTMEVVGNQWAPLTLLAMLAVFCLPRQFQVTVVENVDERHLNKAIWLFPLYLLLINIFVLPIAFGGLLRFPLGTVDADTYVLALPLAEGAPGLALFAFIGGLSAATGMVIVATVALSTMICNDLIMPVLLRFAWLHLSEKKDLSGLLLAIRRGAIAFILLIGYLYFVLIGELLRTGKHRTCLVRRRRPVRARHPRRNVLETGISSGRPPGNLRRVPGVGLHAAAAVVRAVRLVSGGVRRAWAVRDRSLEAIRVVRSRGTRSHLAFPVLEPFSECGLAGRGLARRSPEHDRADSGDAVRRGGSAGRDGRRRRQRLAGQRLDRRFAGHGGTVSWP